MRHFFLIFFLFSISVFAQNEQEPEHDYTQEISSFQIDSMDWNFSTPVQLGATKAFSLNLKTADEKKYYLWLEKRVDDVYPFVQKAVYEYYHVKDSARNIKNEKVKKEFIRNRYNKLADEYEEKLKKLSVSRGQILTRMIERETKITTYDMIKELRGGMNAFLWNAAGGAFNINLKDRFDTKKTREDLFIEVIIQRGLASGKYSEITDRQERVHRINPILRAFGRN
ncbi:MAG: DUF4294 domain-containing protein [Flavobacteriaceae bacterium]|nr:DUF4294 domain-containing protein [Flavobacteriaceae bacterium]